jgi:hypothetical protein
MKFWVAFAGAFLMLSACGSSKEAKEALTAMNLADGGHGNIRYDSQSGSGAKMTFKGVKIRLGDDDNAPKLKIETMAFDGLKMSGKDAVFSELTLTGITPELPKDTLPAGMTVRLDKVALKKPNDAMAKAVTTQLVYLSDPKNKPQPAEPDAQSFTFGQLMMGGLAVKGPIDDPGAKGNLDFHVNEVSMSDAKNLHLEDVQFGKFLISGVALKVDNLKVASGNVAGKGEFALGEFSITDLKHLTEKNQEVGKVLLSGLTLKGEGTSDEGSGTFDAGLREISLTDLKRASMDGQEFGQFLISGLSFKGDGAGQGVKGHIEGGLGEISLAGLKSDLANGKVDFSKFLVSNVSTIVNIDDGKSPVHVGFGLSELSGANVRDSKIGSFVLAGLKGDVDAPDESAAPGADGKPKRIKGSVDFGTYNLTNLDYGLYARVIEAASYTDDSGNSAHALGDVIRSSSSPIEPLYDSLTWSGMKADISGFKFVSSRMETKVERDAKGVATHVLSPKASVAFSVDPAVSDEAKAVADQMAELGLKDVELHFGSDVKFDPAQDTTRLSSFNIGSAGLAELNVGGGAKGLTKGIAAAIELDGAKKPNPTVKADLDNMTILDFDLSLTDQKLMQLIFTAMAKNAGGKATVESMRADAAKQVAAMKKDMTKAGIDAALATDITTALAGFVQKPGTLHIKLAPPRPVPFRMLGDKGVTKSSIGFSATFTPAQ